MNEYTGWLLDVYADPQGGLAVWLLDEGSSERLRFRQDFPVTFYATGPASRLRALWLYLKAQPVRVVLSRCQRRDLFTPQPVEALAVQVEQPGQQPHLFRRVAREFPELSYYDADLPLTLRHAAVHNSFPLARCRLTADGQGQLGKLEILDSPWDLDPEKPPLRILSIEPDVDPSHASPEHLFVRTERGITQRLALIPARPLLINLRALLRRHDPDLLFTKWGDTWLLPRLLELSHQYGVELPFNRDPGMGIARRTERSYFSYGQVIHRGQQMHTFGRWHVDIYNAMLFHDYELEGVLELARVTALPVQTVARVSPGSGISAMQMLTALRQGVLVPWRKQQAEYLKSALDLLRADQGGMVYQPLQGLHTDVAEIDFISMYPSIMAHFNISPETVGIGVQSAERVPELDIYVDCQRPGLVPETLRPLLEKRLAIKTSLTTMLSWEPRRRVYKARASAHKWLLVTCFGYLGYKNARFGRIEAHEAVTAYGREALLRAKEAAEDLGFTVLHMYVDGLWIKKRGSRQVADFQPLIDEITDRTGLPVSLEGIYRWLAFLPSKLDARLPVPNRYFGVFQDGSLKLRGIELRRRDTPTFIIQAQTEMLQQMANTIDPTRLRDCLPEIVSRLRRRLADLRAYRVPLEELLVAQKLSRKLEEYRVPSPAAHAASQLQDEGKFLRPGQMVRFLYTRGKPGVFAWDAAGVPDVCTLDVERYTELLVRASATILQPLRVDEPTLRRWLLASEDNSGFTQEALFPLKSLSSVSLYNDWVRLVPP